MKIQTADIEAIEEKLVSAISNSDIKVLDALLHDDLLCIAPGNPTITKQQDLLSHKAGEMIVDELTVTIENINIMDDTAVVVVQYETKGKMLGTPIEGKFKYIRVWKLFNQQLKVIAASCYQL